MCRVMTKPIRRSRLAMVPSAMVIASSPRPSPTNLNCGTQDSITRAATFALTNAPPASAASRTALESEKNVETAGERPKMPIKSEISTNAHPMTAIHG